MVSTLSRWPILNVWLETILVSQPLRMAQRAAPLAIELDAVSLIDMIGKVLAPGDSYPILYCMLQQ